MRPAAYERRQIAVVRSLASNVRDELDVAHERLGVPADLAGACGFGTVLFWAALDLYRGASARAKHRVFLPRALLVYGWYRRSPRVCVQHCWAEIGKLIVDVTATQFGRFPRARVCPRTNPRYESITGTGTDALRMMGHFIPSPRRRRRLLITMAHRACNRTIEEIA